MFAAFQVVGFLLLWYGGVETMSVLRWFAIILLLPGSLFIFFLSHWAAWAFLVLVLAVNFAAWYLVRRKVGEELPF